MNKVNDLPEMDSMQWFVVLARDLAEQPDQHAASQRLLTLITTATGCSAASLVRLSPAGELICDHATDPGADQRHLRHQHQHRRGRRLGGAASARRYPSR